MASPPIPEALPRERFGDLPLGGLPVLLGLFVLATVILLAISWKQSAQGRGSRQRWFLTSLVCAALAGFPLLCGILISRLVPSTVSGAPVGTGVSIVTIGSLASAVAVFWFVRALKPFAWVTGRPLPEVTEERILARVDAIARRVGVPCPVVRQIPGGGEMFGPGAWMSGLAAPVLVLTDAILLRFTPEEQDAIIAHELGHIVNRSIWWYALTVPLAGTALLLCAPRLLSTHDSPVPHPVALSVALLGLAIFTGLRRVISRALEYDSDRRAGRATRFPDMAAALLKLHVLHPIRSDGLLSWLFYSVATHPSRDERIAALARQAPADDPVAVPVDRILARRRTWAVRTALVLWLAALITAYRLFGGDHPGETTLGNWLLIFVCLTPWMIQVAAVRQQAVIHRRRSHTPSRKRRGLWIAAGTAVGAIAAFALLAATESWARPYGDIWMYGLAGTMLTLVGSLLAMLWFLIRGADPQPSAGLANEAAVLLYENRPAELLELLASKSERVQDVPAIQLTAATAEGMLGYVEIAIARLERLIDSGRAPPMALANLMVLRLEEGNGDKALAAARVFAKRLPRDPLGPILVAVACCELGEWDEAEREAARSERLREGQADPLLIRARVAAGRGDFAQAEQLLERAEAIAPGDTGIKFSRFRLAIDRGDAAAARALLPPLQNALDATPWLLLQRRTARLVERLETLEAADQTSDGEASDPR